MPSRLPAPSLRALRPNTSIPPGSQFSGIRTSSYARAFSQSCPRQSQMRDEMYQWLLGSGKKYKRANPDGPNYLDASGPRRSSATQIQKDGFRGKTPIEEVTEAIGQLDDVPANPEDIQSSAVQTGIGQMSEEEEYYDTMNRLKKARDAPSTASRRDRSQTTLQPFPQNPHFVSQPVLSEELKEEIYKDVKAEGKTIRETSERFQVSMERVGAVVRMKQMERDWLEQGKPLAVHYARAVTGMLPQTPLSLGKINIHEPINDLPVHSYTTQQIFWPTSESREFTRVDAGKVFSPTLLPADMRIPHPEMIEKQSKEVHKTRAARLRLEQAIEKRVMEQKLDEERRTKVVEGGRWNFKFKDVSVQWVGKDGRNRKGVGWRYGMPHEDRKRGQIKIPTSVD